MLSSSGEGLLSDADGSSIEAKVAKICPHFDRLKEVFGKRVQDSQPILLTTDELLPVSPQLSPASPALVNDAILDESTSAAVSIAPSSMQALTAPCMAPRTTIASRTPTNSISQLAAIQKEKISLEKIKLEYEKNKFERDKKIEESKVLMEEKRIEIEAKKVELEDKWKVQDMEGKKLELEMRERVAKYEIDKKYNK
ncbi:PREDICTED: uncharacterized protein LOC108360677 [Rhagoletis zephyria]|uniref:uncharacterized protein LOC108360677 n=1 Tax=Rhagoletis zephyria TaxID=28612 RepID=UPI0008114F74|nr:PREDICTED: uncharacterized protein LOC108360677 [Rhagoletis zephyria]